MDVDLGITLGASGGQYGTIKSDLAGLGFVPEGDRLVRKFGHLGLYLDFLTEDPPSDDRRTHRGRCDRQRDSWPESGTCLPSNGYSARP